MQDWDAKCYDEYRIGDLLLGSKLDYEKYAPEGTKFRIIKREIIEEVIM